MRSAAEIIRMQFDGFICTEVVMKKPFAILLAITLIMEFGLLLSSCEKSYDDKMFDFYRDTRDGQYNAIEINLGNDHSAIYFINERYGVWLNKGEKQLFDFDYVPEVQGGGELMIFIATQQSYYESIIQQNNGFASFYKGKMVFSGSCEFSDNETVATISPDRIYINEMFIDPNQTVTLTKKRISDEEIIPMEVALNNMNYVPDVYFKFLSDKADTKLSCDMANLWVDGSTMVGEWNTNGSIIPIRMNLHEKVPYVEIYDVSSSIEKLILKSYVNVVDDSTIELVSPEGKIFYTTPSTPVTITKIN